MARTPRGYDGSGLTSHHAGKLATTILQRIKKVSEDQPEAIIKAWPDIIGPQLASMAEATAVREGVLWVRVKNSTFHSLLRQRDKAKLLEMLRKRFPQIRDIAFRIG